MPTPSVTNAMKPCAAAADVGRRLLVDVDLAGDEEEVVADAVQQDADVEHPHQRAGVAVGEQHVARGPRGHADEQHPLHAEPAEEPRHDQHEDDLRHLAERHLAGGVGHADLVQERVREGVVELQRNADQERADHEDGERAVLHQLQRVEAEHVAAVPLCARASSAACAAASGRRGRAPPRPPRRSASARPSASTPSVADDRARRRSSRSCRARGSPGTPSPDRRMWWNDSELRERQRRHVAERVAEQDARRTRRSAVCVDA